MWSSHGDGEPRWVGPAHLDPVMRRHKARFPSREALERLEAKLEKAYRCRCGKALDPLERGLVCGGCRE